MTYSETENEHQESISAAIVHLRNEVARLFGSASNMRGQGLACDDPERARALYESGAAYADAARRIGEVQQEFEQADSFRAGAMEAIGPVLTYDALEQQTLSAERALKSMTERVTYLESQFRIVDAELGGNGRASTDELVVWVASTAKALRRFRGIREHAMKIVEEQTEQGIQSLGTLADVVTVLLDGEYPEVLRRLRVALGADVPDVVAGKFEVPFPEPEVPRPSVLGELHEQIQRVTGQAPVARFEPSVDQIVTGYDVTDVDGDLTTGRVTFVASDAVTVELPKYRASTGWYVTHVSLDRTDLRPALPQESNDLISNMEDASEQLASEDAGHPAAGPLDTDTPYIGKLANGGLFTGLYVGTTDAGMIKLQRPVKGPLGEWGVRLELVSHESVSVADAATAQEFHRLVDQSEAEIHGVPDKDGSE